MSHAEPVLEEVGRTIAGRYEVIGVLGRGGMAAVYRVRDTRNGRMLALKRGYASDPHKALKRQALLEREYHTLAQLAHPRIIEVFDYGVDASGPYYTMELLDGGDLSQGPVPWREVCALLRDVASSLAILHSRGLIHRDVSTRNVRCGADGRAKLIDFGAMATTGVAKDVVGTPPFVAPEVVQMQELDPRSDLFSLGALGYHLLTGRHAYPGRRLSELRDVWRSAPVPPARLVPEVPATLSALVMQLLALDRNARPRTAAEVMSKLCAIADLPVEEQLAVSRAYLATPALVGRERALTAVRRRMLSLVRGDGDTLLIDGPGGSGRSRLLDACVLEAKLLGATVVRADASDAQNGDWGVARSLAAQLFELLPKEAGEASRLSRDVLGHLLDVARDEHWPPVSAAIPERSLLIRELRDFLLSLGRSQRLVIAVDDLNRIDEPSLAFLAALAHKTNRYALILVLAVDRESRHDRSPSLQLLRSISDVVEIEQLEPAETEALMRSVFGDLANLALCAGRIHALAQGSPRATMELAQHLVNRGLARYEAGSWSLPAALDEGDLPRTLAASLAARIAELGSDARELCEGLALADREALTLVSYPALTAHGDPRRVFRALDELVAARVLCADPERYHFSQRGFLHVVQESLSPERRRVLHERIADLLALSGGDVVARAYHLLHAERDLEAIELLCSINLLAQLPDLELLELAADRAEQLRVPARTLHQLRIAVLSKASLVLAAASFRRTLAPVLRQLELDSGLAAYRELAELPPQQRLPQALTMAQQRYLETPERDRVYGVADAIRELARIAGTCASMAPSVFDLELIESLPALEPLEPLSPAIGVVSTMLRACKDWIAGRADRGRAAYDQILLRISEPDRAGMDDAQHARTRLGLNYGLGLLEGYLGCSSAEQRAQVLDGDRELRVNAWRVRMVMHLAQGNAEEAHKCQRRSELLQLQEGLGERYLGGTAGFEVGVHSASGDLLGVKQAVAALHVLSDSHTGWRLPLLFGQCRVRQLQGDPQGALDALLRVLPEARPGRHAFYGHLVGLHVSLLGELGRNDEAVERGRAYVAICNEQALMTRDHSVYLETAIALARAGEHAEALTLMAGALECAQALKRGGLALGTVYEARARVAIHMNARADFEHFAELCATEYAKGKSPALAAKFAALMQEAREHAELGSVEPPAPGLELSELSQIDSEYDTLQSRIAECVDPQERARCTLTILLQQLDSFAGYLYGVDNGPIKLLAALPEAEPERTLRDWLQARVHAELDPQYATITAEGDSEDADTAQQLQDRFTDAEGRTFEAMLLLGKRSSFGRLAAIVALQVQPGPRNPPDRALLAEIADQLLEHGDVAGASV